ncbi:MAG: nucleotidyltransferase domain-containing protein [Myxococcota bacterium]
MSRAVAYQSRPLISAQDFTRNDVVHWLRQKLAGRVHEAYLFGSIAMETAKAWSDLDVLIIKPSTQPYVERPLEFQDLFELGLAVDVLVYTPEEYATMAANPTPFFRDVISSQVRVL